MAQSKVKLAIGIDLGTTSSAVGVWRNGKVEIIPNDRGQRTTPSYIAFTGVGGRLIGDAAKSQMLDNPENTIWGFKTLLGRSFDDPAVQEGIKHWPFDVVNLGGKPNVAVEQNGETKHFTPEELTCLLLLNLRHMAEANLGQAVTDGVITIPAGFNSFQVAATKRAAELAGLNVLKLISDPNAAALAYVDKTGTGGGGGGKRNLLVFNAGGGTTGASVVTVDDMTGILEVKATIGNTNLGGEHFLNKLVLSVCSAFKKKIRDGPLELLPFRMTCEDAKKKLSSVTSAAVLIQLKAVIKPITQTGFENLCADLFHQAVAELVTWLMEDSKMKRSDIHEIVLVGGSSRIPKIQCLLQEYFYGKGLNTTLDPDEAPAHGAAILAAVLTRSGDPLLDLRLLKDVAPYSLGVRTPGDIITTLIDRNMTIPAKETGEFTTVYDNQSAVIIAVFEGGGSVYAERRLLGTFFLSDIPSAPAGVPKIEITFEVDVNGTLTVTVVEESTGQQKRITMDPGNGEMLSREDIMKELVDEEAKAKKIQDCQKAYASIKSSYQVVSKLFYSAKESKDFYAKKVKELELEMEGHGSLLTPQEFPIVPASVSRRATNRRSRGGGQVGGPNSKRRRNQ